MRNWIQAYWRDWLINHYTSKMHYYKTLTGYHLHRHNEAIAMYQQKAQYRGYNEANKEEFGFLISEEGADKWAFMYNVSIENYLKYKHKLEALTLQPAPEQIIEPIIQNL